MDLTQQYFLTSFRFDKTTSEDFGLVPSSEQADLFIRKSDGSTWKKKNLYDFGWGNETGFVKQPELDFEGLWYLLLNSGLQENEYGAASELLDLYPDELLTRVEQILAGNNVSSLEPKQKRAFLILKLDLPLNRSKTIGKSSEQISRDFERWRAVSEKIAVLSERKEKHRWWKFW